MKKIIVAIAAVFCLQIGFTAYNSAKYGGNASAEAVARLSPVIKRLPPKPAAPLNIEPTPVSPEIAEQTYADVKQPEVASRLVQHTPEKAYIPRRLIKPSLTADRVVEPSAFRPGETITIQYASYRQPEARNFDVKPVTIVTSEPKAKKRSMIKKTGSVLTRPFRWMKNLIAKLD